MTKYNFKFLLNVSVGLLTDDEIVVQQAEKESGKKLTYENIEAELADLIRDHLEDFDSNFDITITPVREENKNA